MDHRPKVKSIGATKGKKWRELQSCRSFRSVNIVRDPDRYNNPSGLMDRPPRVRQNAKETSDEIFNDNVVIVEPVVGSEPLMPEDRYEEYRKCGFDVRKDAVTESVDVCEEEKGGKRDHGKKTVRWVDDDEKSLMDLGISEDERTKRLENLMEKRRSSKWSGLRVRRNAMGNATGNVSCDQISSLNIPKINPFLAKSSGGDPDPTSPVPGSAPSNVVESNPFDLPYDPHEEKPILTGDDFEEELTGTPRKKEPRHVRFSLGNFDPPETTKFHSDFAIKQLSSGKLVTTALENKEDDDKHPQQDSSIPNDGIGDHHAREEGESSEKAVDVVDIANKAAEPEAAAEKAADVVDIAKEAAEPEIAEKAADLVSIANEEAEPEAAEKAVDVVPVADSVPDEASGTEREEVHREVVSSDQQSSSTSSYSSEDEPPILRPNKEAILHSLSMSRMRLASASNNFLRHAESYDCGPSALFDKSKTDGFFFGSNKRIHYPSACSFASDMQVEVSEVGSPPSTNRSSLDDEASIMDTEKGKRGVMVNSTDPSEMDVDEWSDHEDTTEDEFSRWDYHREPLESIKMNEQGAHYFTKKDGNEVGNQETKDGILETETKVSNSEMEHRKPPIFVLQSESSIEANLAYEVLNEVQHSVEPPTENDRVEKDRV